MSPTPDAPTPAPQPCPYHANGQPAVLGTKERLATWKLLLMLIQHFTVRGWRSGGKAPSIRDQWRFWIII